MLRARVAVERTRVAVPGVIRDRPVVAMHEYSAFRGKINGSFLAAGLIDELSVLVAPIADGAIGTPSLFDLRERKRPARRLKLVSFEKRADDLLWLRYRLKR